MTLEEFNSLEEEKAAKELFSCCGSENWTLLLMKTFPFSSTEELVKRATSVWYDECGKEDWLQSFARHPQIGDKKSLQQKFAGKEQEAVVSAGQEVIDALAKANKDYLQRFGFIFIVCATGKSAYAMMKLVQDRLKNSREEELNIAMGEQHKITLLRFQKLLTDANFKTLKMSQLTTHVLDIAMGGPGRNIAVKLLQPKEKNWQVIAQGITNEDGRIADLLPPERVLAPGNYKLVFETGAYFASKNTTGFYPEVEIQFTINDNTHYHVPLLLNLFGYSTYRGT